MYTPIYLIVFIICTTLLNWHTQLQMFVYIEKEKTILTGIYNNDSLHSVDTESTKLFSVTNVLSMFLMIYWY